MDADNSVYVKSIATYAPTFFGYIISVLASVVNVNSMNEVFSSLKCRSRIPTFGSLFGPNHTDGAFWLGLHYGGSDGKFKKAILSYLLKILLFKENEQKSCFSKVKKFWKKIRKIVKKKLKNVEKKC